MSVSRNDIHLNSVGEWKAANTSKFVDMILQSQRSSHSRDINQGDNSLGLGHTTYENDVNSPI